jgi:hypothetical protein
MLARMRPLGPDETLAHRVKAELEKIAEHGYETEISVTHQVSTREAAKRLGITLLTLQRHVSAGTLNAPPLSKVGGVTVRLWTLREIENARTILADIKPGRKKKA